jgi:hypothetical protein
MEKEIAFAGSCQGEAVSQPPAACDGILNQGGQETALPGLRLFSASSKFFPAMEFAGSRCGEDEVPAG